MGQKRLSFINRIVKSGATKSPKPTKLAMKMAENIDKEIFLGELLEQWYPHIQRDSSVEEELSRATTRIEKSGYKPVFDKVGITEEDIKQVIVDIQNSKPETIKSETKVGRNAPCPCGSGKKYKKCCDLVKE